MAQKKKRKVESLLRMMKYILEKRPDEFGLAPDQEGFIQIKGLLHAIREETNMAYVRESHLREVILQDKDHLFEIDGKKIRSTKRDFFPIYKADAVFSPPKLLFKAVKRKAYPAIVKTGLVPGAKEHIVMTTDRDLALRMAQRLDQRPIILEIRAHAANDNGIPFYPFGESLYVSDRIPTQFINGPPLPKDLSEKKGPVKKERETTLGSFIMRVENDPDLKRRMKAKKRIEWKQEGKKVKGGKRLAVRKARSSQHFGY